jgi:Arc/MetJ-type ribon-helix-helix transcriptional regulator
MNLALKPDVQELIDERVTLGKYSSPEDVVAAAIMALGQQEQFGDFQAGELDKLLAEGERSIKKDGTLDGEEAYRRRRQQRAPKRKSAP